jgi:YD repeat-containing protein
LTPPSAFATGSFSFNYDALGRRTQLSRPNSVVTSYSYDNLSRLQSVLHQLSGSTIDGASYTVDNAGNRTAKTDQRTAVATSYGYDNIYQLLSATPSSGTAESYTYNPVGNRLSSAGVPSYTVNSSNELIATSGASVTSRVTLPSNITYIEPDLQAQDGTYFGLVDYDFDEIDDFLAKFDAAGNIQWAVPNYYAKMATADGGVIAQSLDGSSTVTFDANGNATGQLANLPQYPSWLGNGYNYGSVEQVATFLPNLAQTFAALFAGNFSNNGTAIKQEWFPSLDYCTSTPGCIGHHDAIYNALSDLIVRLNDKTPITLLDGSTITLSGLAQTSIFNKLGRDQNGKAYSTNDFLSYLQTQTPLFYDGTISNYCAGDLTPPKLTLVCKIPVINSFRQKVQDAFATSPSRGALTATPQSPMLSFLRPQFIGFPATGKNLGNEATLFHEALHGWTGLLDDDLLTRLGMSDTTHAPCSITVRIEHAVLRNSQGIDSTDSWNATCPTQGDE